MLHKNLRSDHVPSKNLKSDHAPSKNEYDRVPPKWPQNLVEHGHFSNSGGTLSFLKFWWKINMTRFHQNLRNDHAPQKFEKRPYSIEKFEK